MIRYYIMYTCTFANVGLGAMSESRDVGITRQGTTKVSIEVFETASAKAR